MKARALSNYDLIGVVGLSFLYLVGLLAVPGGAVQVLLGLPFALFLPGYAILAATDPFPETTELSTQLALSCVLSLTLVTLLAMGLNAIGKLTLIWLVLGLELAISGGCMVAFIRRSQSPARDRASLSEALLGLRHQAGLAIALGILVVLVFALVTQAIIELSSGEQEQTYTTAFYLLGEERMAGNYPDEVVAGEMVSVTTGITNREGMPANYRIEVRVGEQLIGAEDPIALADGETWEGTVRFTPSQAGKDQQVLFWLYRDGGSEPYRTLRLRVNVTAN